MATTEDFIKYVCDQVQGTGEVRYKKMFGEYMVYIDEKPILLVCDNTVYVKISDSLNALMADAEKGYPYQGAKERYILDIDDSDKAKEVIKILLPEIPLPKRKR